MAIAKIRDDMTAPWRWGLLLSIGIHGVLLYALLFPLPVLPLPEPAESVQVELVPPPPPAKQDDDHAAEDQRSPRAFESPAPGAEKVASGPPSPTTPDPDPAPLNEAPPASDASARSAALAQSSNPASTGQRALPDEERNATASERVRATASGDESHLPAEGRKSGAAQSGADGSGPDKAALAAAEALYSGQTLSNPHVQQALGKLPPRDRIIQICSIEALEQIRHQRPGTFPDVFAPGDGRTTDTSFVVDNGAFRTRGTWISMRFECTVELTKMAVTQFRYLIGGAIPRDQWTVRQFPVD
jgi:hypothetical protein